MNQSIGRFPFVVEPFSEDYSGRLSWFFLGNHLLRCASLHAGTHGFGFNEVKESNRAWVLSRLVVEMNHMPRSGEAYVVETWVSKIYRQFTDRLFSIMGEDGKVYGYASSVWALIDRNSREAIDFSTLNNTDFLNAVVEQEVPIQGPGRVRVKSEEPVRLLKASYSDLDINGHVNSIRYIQMALDILSEELCDKQKSVKRLEVAYCNESYCGDMLQFFHVDEKDGRHEIEIRKEDGVVLVKIAILLD